MQIKSMEMAWMSVKNLKEAVSFYTEVIGLKLMEMDEKYGWAELQGHEGGARLGLAQISNEGNLFAEKNAIVTMTVENLDKACAELKQKGASCVGPVEEVEGHVRLQMVQDKDGNRFQLVQKLF
jgi:predicted enzyme related to lactoylglutathione lyase